MRFDLHTLTPPRVICTLLTVFLGILAFTAGCSGLQASPGESAGSTFPPSADGQREYIFENVKEWIALAPAESGAPKNDHPVDLDAQTLKEILSGIQARLDPSRRRGLFKDENARIVRVFTDAALDEIAEPLAMAFKRATERQDVLLYVRQWRMGRYVKLSGERVVTTARLFHRKGRLHILFGAVDAAVGAAASTDPRNSPKSGSYRSPATLSGDSFPLGSRDRAAALQARLRADRSVAGGPAGREDWLVLDPHAPEMEKADAAPLSAPRKDEAKDKQRAPVPESANALESLDEATLERLRELRELRRQDLISEQVYESMVREILDMPPRTED